MSDIQKFLDIEGVKTLWSQVSLNDYPNNETLIAVINAIDETKADKADIPLKVSQLENDSNFVSEEYVETLYTKLNSNTVLGFYCVEDVTIIINGISKIYPANSNVEIRFAEDDVWEIVPTSNNSILTLTAFPGALGTYYSWLEGVKQFSNILFDMNAEDMYTKWNQGNQGAYQVQYAQYTNCIFWSDNPYINDVAKRTNYTLYNSSQLPLCYSSIPENTFKAFYLALGVNNDPNWSNSVYKESFAQATWATQVFSYYGARVIGTPEHFSITLPVDCRGLMFYATNTEAAGTFDATNVTNFGAKSGSWREAFGYCSSLRRLYIENLKVNLNISWSPIDYNSIYYIISNATNTNAITISVSPYTYNLLSESDFELATSKNITIELLSDNYVEDKRLNDIANKADKTEVPTNLTNGSSEGSLRGINALAEDDSYTIGVNAFAIGNNTKASGKNSFASGQDVEATGSYAHAEGYGTFATAAAAHAEGYDTHATARYAHAEGASTTASGNNSHAEGNNTTSSGHYSHAEGNFTTAAGGYSHAEGNYSQTGENGTYAHAEGSYTQATKTGAHAEGNYTEANGIFSHSEGQNTLANSMYQHVRGKYNIADDNDVYSTIIGGGDSDSNRKNIFTLDWEGNGWFKGDLYINSTSGIDKDEGSLKVATETYVDENFLKKDDSGDIITEGEIKASNIPYTVSEVTLLTIPAATIQEALTNSVKNITVDTFEHDASTIVYAYYGDKEYASFTNEENYIEFFISNPYVTDGFACSIQKGVDADGNEDTTKAKFNYRVLDTENVTDFVLMQITVNTIDSKYFDHDMVIINSLSMNRRGDIGTYSTALGGSCVASGHSSFANGLACEATGAYSTAVGKGSFATGEAGLSTGLMTTAGREAFASGRQTKATGRGSLATGNSTTASGQYSLAEGQSTQATSSYTHAEGLGSIAKATGAHAEGNYTLASSAYQHAAGKYNIEDTASAYAYILGNGSSSTRSNAYTLDWAGVGWFASDVYVGSTSGTNKDEGSKKLATEEYVDIRVPTWTEADEGKILQIVNGTPAWVSLPNAEEASF